MSGGTLAKRVTRVYRAEQMAEARSLYEGGLSLEGVAEKLGIPYSTIQNHAWVEGWPVRSRGGQRDPRYQAAKARQIRRKLEKEEKRLEQDLALVKTEDLELLAQRSLAAESARAKLAISRRVIDILSRLDASVPVRSAAQALGSLAPILRLVYGWDREPDLQRMERAKTSYADLLEEAPNNAVNLRLIATTPDQLRQIADAQLAKERREPRKLEANPNQHNQPGPSASECNGQCVGLPPVAPERPEAATHSQPTPEKEAATGSAMPPLLAPEQPVQDDLPSSHAAQEQERRRKAFEQARADHRRACREKYR